MHDALADERAMIGDLRRNGLFTDLPPVNLDEITPTAAGIERAQRLGLQAAAAAKCRTWHLELEKLLLASAIDLAARGDTGSALARCADVAALERDRFVVGTLTDAMLGVSALGLALRTCAPIVDAAPPAAAAELGASIAAIRKSCPADVDDMVRRDLAEMSLATLGQLWGANDPFPCERARNIAHVARAPQEPSALVEAWKARKNAVADGASLDVAKYRERYAEGLHDLDVLIAHARR